MDRSHTRRISRSGGISWRNHAGHTRQHPPRPLSPRHPAHPAATSVKAAHSHAEHENEVKLDAPLLREIAQLTHGNYYQATPSEAEIERLYEDLASLERREIEERQFTQYEERFQYFLGFALLFLVWELLLTDLKRET
ncbi:hypothetical protein HYR99_36895 [Candidatus Poribacteria bacterium]|nr:hypothetical protein [Candidatus Poribacteria bacterium]